MSLPEPSGKSRLDLPFSNSGRRSVSPSGATSLERYSSTLYGTSQEGTMFNDELLPPSVPFSTSKDLHKGGGSQSSSRRSSLSSFGKSNNSNNKDKDSKATARQSLSVNYVPTKFTKLHAPGVHAHHTAANRRSGAGLAKMGGGRDAFAADAGRMGAMGTVDDDEGLVFQMSKGGLEAKSSPKLRWNKFKWTLFIANTVLIIYGLAGLISAILVWLNIFNDSAVIRAGNRTELIISTLAAGVITFTSLIGYSGILLNNRAFCAVYTLMLWVCLALIVTPGYMTYKWRTFNLEGKLNSQWSRHLGEIGRLQIQDALKCCGYYNSFVEATISPLCYPRSIEPGCKEKYMKSERTILGTWYTISFSLVPAHILIILAALLCSNHITYRFGKGVTPKRYRLDLGSMAVIMDEYASQIAAKYGPEVAVTALSQSSTALNESEIVPPASRNSFLTTSSSHTISQGLTRPISRVHQQTRSSLFDESGRGSSSLLRVGSDSDSHYGKEMGSGDDVMKGRSEMSISEWQSEEHREWQREAGHGIPILVDDRDSKWTDGYRDDDDKDIIELYGDVENKRR